ncbi:MAG: PA2778 family cysteine peptidase [Pseudomonadota bacterium]|nr:PA2778 family cysteine peptidase [Pseudomonadota bacterium]
MRPYWRIGWVFIACIPLLWGCTTTLHHNGESPIELTDAPFFPQTRYQCGPAALATVLVAAGADTSPEHLVDRVYLPGRQGSLQPELVATIRAFGMLPYPIEGISEIRAQLRSGHPVLVLQNLGHPKLPRWHYAVVVGWDEARQTVILRSGTTKRLAQRRSNFLRSWQWAGSWGVIALPPDELPAQPDMNRYLSAAWGLESVDQRRAAGSAYRAATTRWPMEALGWLALANNQAAMGEIAEARQTLTEGLRTNPTSVPLMINLADVLLESGELEEALHWAGQAAEQTGPWQTKAAELLDEAQARMAAP